MQKCQKMSKKVKTCTKNVLKKQKSKCKKKKNKNGKKCNQTKKKMSEHAKMSEMSKHVKNVKTCTIFFFLIKLKNVKKSKISMFKNSRTLILFVLCFSFFLFSLFFSIVFLFVILFLFSFFKSLYMFYFFLTFFFFLFSSFCQIEQKHVTILKFSFWCKTWICKLEKGPFGRKVAATTITSHVWHGRSWISASSIYDSVWFSSNWFVFYFDKLTWITQGDESCFPFFHRKIKYRALTYAYPPVKMK